MTSTIPRHALHRVPVLAAPRRSAANHHPHPSPRGVAGETSPAQAFNKSRIATLVLSTIACALLSACSEPLHTNMSKAEMTSMLQSTFEIGMSEPEVVRGIDELGLRAEYGKRYYSRAWVPDITAVVPDDRPHFVYAYGLGMLAFDLDDTSNALLSIEYVTLSIPRKPRDWWPETPVLMLGDKP